MNPPTKKTKKVLGMVLARIDGKTAAPPVLTEDDRRRCQLRREIEAREERMRIDRELDWLAD